MKIFSSAYFNKVQLINIEWIWTGMLQLDLEFITHLRCYVVCEFSQLRLFFDRKTTCYCGDNQWYSFLKLTTRSFCAATLTEISRSDSCYDQLVRDEQPVNVSNNSCWMVMALVNSHVIVASGILFCTVGYVNIDDFMKLDIVVLWQYSICGKTRRGSAMYFWLNQWGVNVDLEGWRNRRVVKQTPLPRQIKPWLF